MVGSFRADDSTTLGAKEAFVSHAAGLAGRGGSTYIDSVILRDRDNSGGWNNAAPTSSAAVSADLNFNGSISSSPSGPDRAAFNASDSANLGKSGKGVLSSSGVTNRKGYAGYEWDPVLNAFHVRHRVYRPDMGRWMSRENSSSEYELLYAYCDLKAISSRDDTGLFGDLVLHDSTSDSSTIDQYVAANPPGTPASWPEPPPPSVPGPRAPGTWIPTPDYPPGVIFDPGPPRMHWRWPPDEEGHAPHWDVEVKGPPKKKFWVTPEGEWYDKRGKRPKEIFPDGGKENVQPTQDPRKTYYDAEQRRRALQCRIRGDTPE